MLGKNGHPVAHQVTAGIILGLLVWLCSKFFFKIKLKEKKETKTLDFKKMTKEEFIKMMVPTVKEVSKSTGIPASFLLSQIALETAWGKSELFYKYFNVGGIRSFKPESEPHGFYWTWEHVKKEDLSKWDKYERKKAEDTPVMKDGKPTGKIKIRVKLPFRHFPDIVTGISYYLKNVLLNSYFKKYIAEANGDAKKYVTLLQSKGKDGKTPQYATDTNYVSKVHTLIDEMKQHLA